MSHKLSSINLGEKKNNNRQEEERTKRSLSAVVAQTPRPDMQKRRNNLNISQKKLRTLQQDSISVSVLLPSLFS